MTEQKMIACHGEDCCVYDKKKNGYVKIKHPESVMRISPRAKKLNSRTKFCPSCYEKVYADYMAEMKLYSTIREYFFMTSVTNGMRAQIAKYRKEYGYSFADMDFTLRYFKNQKDGRFTKKSLGILPYVYNEAMEFKAKQEARALELNSKFVTAKAPDVVEIDMVAAYEAKKRKEKSWREKQQFNMMEDFIDEL